MRALILTTRFQPTPNDGIELLKQHFVKDITQLSMRVEYDGTFMFNWFQVYDYYYWKKEFGPDDTLSLWATRLGWTKNDEKWWNDMVKYSQAIMWSLIPNSQRAPEKEEWSCIVFWGEGKKRGFWRLITCNMPHMVIILVGVFHFTVNTRKNRYDNTRS